MTAPIFSVHATSRYERLSAKLQEGHREFDAVEQTAVSILSSDPYNRSRLHDIKSWKP